MLDVAGTCQQTEAEGRKTVLRGGVGGGGGVCGWGRVRGVQSS